jgi:hypothetical protein
LDVEGGIVWEEARTIAASPENKKRFIKRPSHSSRGVDGSMSARVVEVNAMRCMFVTS